jgi:hypothetical protein
MRHALLLVVLCLGFCTLAARAQEATAEEKSFFDKNVGKLVKLEPTPLTGEALAKVFTAKFYSVKVSMGDDGGMTTLTAARKGNDLAQVSTPGTTADMPALKALVKPDFKLKTDTDGIVFQAALDILYPIDERFDKEDAKAKAVKHSGTQWTFVRGKFFDDLKGIVVTTDANGTITKIAYSLEIKK